MTFKLFVFLIAHTWNFWVSSISVETQLGTLHGWTGLSRDGREYSAFTKIPFAKAPMGTLRLKNPVPFGRWQGVLNATEELPHCIQLIHSSLPGTDYIGTEDCLYLSIYVPKDASETLPVLFYIHGGAFQVGHPGKHRMADFIMDEKVILVVVTYRLNLFGFLSLEDKNIPGNFGLKDQALALKWVKDNIHSFGGDSERIVIFGESAGGASAHHLLLSPLTKHLISGAVSISGTVNLWSLGDSGEVRNASLRVVTDIGCSERHSRDVLDCLQNVDVNRLIYQITKGMSILGKIRFKPCVEPEAPGAVIPTNPITNASVTSQAPWIVSFTNGEYLLSYNKTKSGNDPRNFTRLVDKLLARKLMREVSKPSSKWDNILKTIADEYGNKGENIEIPRALAQINADSEFLYPTLDALHRQSGNKYFYTFQYRREQSIYDHIISRGKEDIIEARHGEELAFMFASNRTMNATDTNVSKQYIKLLANFAHYQNPTPKGAPVQWKPWTKNEVLRITPTGHFVMGDLEFYDKLEKTYNMWKDITPMS